MTMHMSILSNRAAQNNQLKIGGKIRSGIKLLTRTAMNNKQAVQIYERGLAERRKFSEIEKEITEKTSLKNPLYPRNTPYFNVAVSDFGMPEICKLLLEKYGEVRDGSVNPQLYRFPIVFHSDNLEEIYPNKLIRHGGKPGYESVYGEDGIRYCQYLPEVTQEMLAAQKANRIKRPPRREKVIRGICETSTCQEYLQGQCKFRGRLHFYIPGVPTGLVAMETSSEYAAEGIWSDLSRIREAFGNIPRVNPNRTGAFLFYLTKVQETRTYFDENGNQQTGLQWVPKLEADIDIGTLMLAGMTPQPRLASTPVAWLAAPKGMPDAEVIQQGGQVEPPVTVGGRPLAQGALTVDASQDPFEQVEDLMEQMQLEHELVENFFEIKLGPDWKESDEVVLRGVQMLKELSRKGAECARYMIEIGIVLNSLGIDTKAFMEYAIRKYKPGYQNNPATLKAVHDELMQVHQEGGSAVNYFKAQFSDMIAA